MKEAKFKAVDKVRRIEGEWLGMSTGDIATIKVPCSENLSFEEYEGLHDTSKFELVKEEQTGHKYKDLIIAWANGAKIQVYEAGGIWQDSEYPAWYPDCTYRIKPEPKPDFKRYAEIISKQDAVCVGGFSTSSSRIYADRFDHTNLELTFCGETGKLKHAQVIDTKE